MFIRILSLAIADRREADRRCPRRFELPWQIAIVRAARGVEFSSHGGGGWKSKVKVPPSRLHTATFSRCPRVAGRASSLPSPHQGTNPVREEPPSDPDAQRPRLLTPPCRCWASGDTRTQLITHSGTWHQSTGFSVSRTLQVTPASSAKHRSRVSTSAITSQSSS